MGRAHIAVSAKKVEACAEQVLANPTHAPGQDTSYVIERQRRRGKLTARRRLTLLFDEDTFIEFEVWRAGPSGLTGIISGTGKVDGRPVFAYAQDFTVAGGTVGEKESDQICRLIDRALDAGAPIVAVNDGGGARIQEGVSALDGYGRVFRKQVEASGVVPQISAVFGPCAGGAAYGPALSDVVFMIEDSFLYLTGPKVVAEVTGESPTHHELGGPDVHAAQSGLAAVRAQSEEDALADVRTLLSYLPSHNAEPPMQACRPNREDLRPGLAAIVPADPKVSYDVRDVIHLIVDDGLFFELFEEWAPNVVTCMADLGGVSVGVVANQPSHLAGALDGSASEKAARFVQFCDAFAIPIISIVDVPGFLPGVEAEAQGIIRRGAKLLHAYCDARVPRIQVILRKAFGGAYIVMDSRGVGSDYTVAWPANEIAVMGTEAAIDIVYRRDLEAADAPADLRERLTANYQHLVGGPQAAAERGFVDDVIEPEETRVVLLRALNYLADKHAPPLRQKIRANGPQ